MKVLIIVFSQTGNTQNVAERIAEGIRESGAGCDIVDLSDAKDLDLGPINRIPRFDIGYPSHQGALLGCGRPGHKEHGRKQGSENA